MESKGSPSPDSPTRAYPDMQHLNSPPLRLHFLANLLYSACRQFIQHLDESIRRSKPGMNETKSKPYVSLHSFAPENFFLYFWTNHTIIEIGKIKNVSPIFQVFFNLKIFYIPFFLSVKSFHTSGSSKLKKY